MRTLLADDRAPAVVSAGLVVALLLTFAATRGLGGWVDERSCAALWASPTVAAAGLAAPGADPDRPGWLGRAWAGDRSVAHAAQRYQVAVRHDDLELAAEHAVELAAACRAAGHGPTATAATAPAGLP